MKILRILSLMIVSLLVFSSTNAAIAEELKFDFKWIGWKDECAEKSPVFKIISAPAGTTRIVFKMTDLDVPSYSHGGGGVKYSGKDIPRGAFKYKGPCPPDGVHKYEWKAVAYDKKNGKELGSAKVMKPFPPKK
jgi:phosphatidylethanolamine-binding protein (PEBP) family uncharacterized protein